MLVLHAQRQGSGDSQRHAVHAGRLWPGACDTRSNACVPCAPGFCPVHALSACIPALSLKPNATHALHAFPPISSLARCLPVVSPFVLVIVVLDDTGVDAALSQQRPVYTETRRPFPPLLWHRFPLLLRSCSRHKHAISVSHNCAPTPSTRTDRRTDRDRDRNVERLRETAA